MEVAMVEAALKSSMGPMWWRSHMCIKQAREAVDVVGEREMRIKSKMRTGASEMKVVNEVLLDNSIGIFLIWAGRPITINSVLEVELEGLRQRGLDDIH